MFVVTKKIDSGNMSKLCRTCLREDGEKMVCLFVGPAGSSLAAKLRSLSCLDVWQGDGLPEKLCDRCVTRAESALLFREQCRVADWALRQAEPKATSTVKYKTLTEVKLYEERQGIVPMKSPPKTPKCTACGAVFLTDEELCAHIRIHNQYPHSSHKHMHIVESDHGYSLPELQPVINNPTVQVPTLEPEKSDRAACALHCSLCNHTSSNSTDLINHHFTHSDANVDLSCEDSSDSSEDSNEIPQNLSFHQELKSNASCVPIFSKNLTISEPNTSAQANSTDIAQDKHTLAIVPGGKGDLSNVNQNLIGNSNDNLNPNLNQDFRQVLDGSLSNELHENLSQNLDEQAQNLNPGLNQDLNETLHHDMSKNLSQTLNQNIPQNSTQMPHSSLSQELNETLNQEINEKLTQNFSQSLNLTQRANEAAALNENSSQVQSSSKSHDSEEKCHKCTYCPKSFSQQSKLQSHVFSHLGQRPFKCTSCDKCYTSKSKLTAHMRLHTNTNVHHCKVCKKTFTHPYYLKEHEKTHEANKGEVTLPSEFECSICMKQFQLKKTLVVHMKTHTNQPQLKCHICYVPFRHKYNLKMHMRLHSKSPSIRKHECDVCSKKFTDNGKLKEHMRIHTKDKPFTCGICGKSFTQSSHLNNHEVTHLAVRPCVCTICGAAFKLSSHLRRHQVATHLPTMKKFQCPLCHQMFTQGYSLKRHLEKHSET